MTLLKLPSACLLVVLLCTTVPLSGEQNIVSVERAARVSDTVILVSLSSFLFDDQLTIGPLTVTNSEGTPLSLLPLERVTSGPLVLEGRERTLVNAFRVRVSENEKLEEGERYTILVSRIKYGEIEVHDVAVPVQPMKQVVKIRDAYQDSPRSIVIRLDADFIEGSTATANIIVSDVAGNRLPLTTHVDEFVDPDGVFSELRVTLASGFLEPDNEYQVFIEEIEDDLFRLSGDSHSIRGFEAAIEFERHLPQRITAIFPSTVAEGNVEVVRVRAGSETPLAVKSIDRFGARDNTLQISLIESVVHGDKILVRATAPGAGRVVASGTAKFAAPKDKKSSELFAKLSAETGKGQKPNVTLDFKADFKERVKLRNHWTFGPKIESVIATRDKDESNKMSFLFDFHRIGFFGGGSQATDSSLVSRSRKIGVYRIEIGPRLEFDKGFADSNVLADFSLELFRLDWLRNQWYFRPAIGWEIGENLGLETKFEDLEGYSISRGVIELNLGTERKLKNKNLESITFSLTYTGRELFSEELDTVDIPEADQTEDSGTTMVILSDGYKDYLTVALALKVTENSGIELKYETGELPGRFEDKDKISLGISYLY